MEVEKIGIVVTTFNRPENLQVCLEALMPQTRSVPQEVVVVVMDDGSKLNNIVIANQVDYYYWQHNAGYRLSTARNIGARILLSEEVGTIIFLDGDLIVQEGWLIAMIDGVKEGLTFGEVNGSVPDVLPLKSRPWLAATGGNMAVTTELWKEVGEFDPTYDGNWGVEDTDFAYRALESGAKLVQQDANVIHKEHPQNFDYNKQQAENWSKFQDKFGAEVGARPTPSRTDTAVEEDKKLNQVMSLQGNTTDDVWLITATRGRPEEVKRWKSERFLWGLKTVIADDNESSGFSSYPNGVWAACTSGVGTSEATRQAIDHAVKHGAKYIIELDDHDTLKRGQEDVLDICRELKNGADYVYGNYVIESKRRKTNPVNTLVYEQGDMAKRGMIWMGVKAYSVNAYSKAGGYIAEDFPAGDYSLALRMELSGCSFTKIDTLWSICPMEIDSLTTSRKGETNDKIREYQEKYI